MELIEACISIAEGPFPNERAFLDLLDEIESEFGVTIQAFDARYVVSRRHIERAVELADRERGRGNSIVRDRGLEILLYAAGRRQIDRALEMGVSETTERLVVLVDATTDSNSTAKSGNESAASTVLLEPLTPANVIGEYDESLLREFYDIGQMELDATGADLEALVLERVALLVVER
ncbi:MAG: KEOPS complex subunit Cgi121 [Natronomonas sp.]